MQGAEAPHQLKVIVVKLDRAVGDELGAFAAPELVRTVVAGFLKADRLRAIREADKNVGLLVLVGAVPSKATGDELGLELWIGCYFNLLNPVSVRYSPSGKFLMLV